MADVFTKAKRSDVMSCIRSHGNRDTELRMAALLRKHRLAGWRRNRRVTGKPDFVWPRERLALFVDGCFWHGCPRCYRRPTSNQAYWDAKVSRNCRRDREVSRLLRKEGWRVVRIWEHDLANRGGVSIPRIKAALRHLYNR